MKKKLFLFPLLLLAVIIFSGFTSASGLNVHNLTGIKDPAEAKKTADQVYAETPFVRDMDREIKMHSSPSPEESKKLSEKVYAETPFVKEATDGEGVDYSIYGTTAAPVPYYFNFDFDSTLYSDPITNGTSTTVRITANGDWEQKPIYFEDSLNDYYDITLYANGQSKGTYRFDTGAWQHADWYNIPSSADMYFVMTKSSYTYSGTVSPDYKGEIVGSGTVLNP